MIYAGSVAHFTSEVLFDEMIIVVEETFLIISMIDNSNKVILKTRRILLIKILTRNVQCIQYV